jgi:hypothetical protein
LDFAELWLGSGGKQGGEEDGKQKDDKGDEQGLEQDLVDFPVRFLFGAFVFEGVLNEALSGHLVDGPFQIGFPDGVIVERDGIAQFFLILVHKRKKPPLSGGEIAVVNAFPGAEQSLVVRNSFLGQNNLFPQIIVGSPHHKHEADAHKDEREDLGFAL